jgi:hypothetical protein
MILLPILYPELYSQFGIKPPRGGMAMNTLTRIFELMNVQFYFMDLPVQEKPW